MYIYIYIYIYIYMYIYIYILIYPITSLWSALINIFLLFMNDLNPR